MFSLEPPCKPLFLINLVRKGIDNIYTKIIEKRKIINRKKIIITTKKVTFHTVILRERSDRRIPNKYSKEILRFAQDCKTRMTN